MHIVYVYIHNVCTYTNILEYAIVRTVFTVYLPVCTPVRSLAHTYTSTHQSMSSLESTNHSESEMLVRGFEWRSYQLIQSHFVRQPLQIHISKISTARHFDYVT